MVKLVAFLQAAQDGNRVLDGRLRHEHGLEPALERRVLFDVLAVFVERGCADAVQFAARQGGLQQVAGVHGAFGRSRADDRVQFVDEQDHIAVRAGDFLQDGLQALLEFAPVLRAGDQRAHVERDQAFVSQGFGHVALHDADRQPLDDGRLADAGFADQDRVVLGAAGEDLHGAADFVVATDHGVELVLAGCLREVAPVFLQRLERSLRVFVRHALVAADFHQGF